jgi:riboflavin biosynthesis pyrimidine reductase
MTPEPSPERPRLTLRRLHPGPVAEVEALEAYAHPGERRWLRANMVASVDGAAVIDGRVGGLSGPADFELLRVLRGLCDVLLVGAATVRAEGYGAVVAPVEAADVRRATGQLAHPRLAVLSRSLDLDLASPAFVEAPERPLVLTTELADPARVREAQGVAEVLVAGERSVDLALALDLLEQRGLGRILSEGGPRALAELYAADLVDELCLAVSPIVVAGREARLTDGAALPVPVALRLEAVHERDEFLFLRYLRQASSRQV